MTPPATRKLRKLLRAHPAAQLVCEATGGYEQPAVRACHAASVPVSVVEAGRVRHYARAHGRRAKTDPIDAAVLSAYVRAFQPAPTGGPHCPAKRPRRMVRAARPTPAKPPG
ncbi:MAG: hypothetical protein RL514_3033 [Verrucomicrobiota bacterium]|jgi:transposase